MKKTKLTRSLLAACSIVALSAVMYGCSSSGENAANTRADNAEDTAAQLLAERDAALAAQATAEAERDAANAARDAALAAQATAEAERDAANTARDAAVAARMAAEQAQANAEAAQMAAEQAQANAEAAQMAAEQAQADAEAAQGMAESERDAANMARDAANAARDAALAAQATAEMERDAANAARDAAVSRADAAEADAMAANTRADEAEKALADKLAELADTEADLDKAERIARELAIRMSITDSTVGGDNRIPASYTAKVGPDATGSGVSAITATRDAAGMIAVDVNGENPDDYSGGTAMAGSGDWNAVMLTMTDAATEATDTLVIYTDIDAPADTLFRTVYTGVTNFLGAAHADNADQADPAKASSSHFPSTASTTYNYGGDSGRPTSFTGMYDGVPGVFACSAATCSLTTNGDGELQGDATNTWSFTPNAPNSATVKVADTGYAWFGWWLDKPKANDGTHDVEVFAGGSTGYEATANNEIEGNVSYTGPAAGKFVTRTFTAGAHTDSGVGHFTATANLTAKFGADDAAGTIGGSVSGFVLNDTESVSWRVVLEDADLTDGSATFAGTSEVNFGGGLTTTDAGRWQGSFYDDGMEDDDAPSAVAGTFDAVTDNASVIGGFGATQ